MNFHEIVDQNNRKVEAANVDYNGVDGHEGVLVLTSKKIGTSWTSGAAFIPNMKVVMREVGPPPVYAIVSRRRTNLPDVE